MLYKILNFLTPLDFLKNNFPTTRLFSNMLPLWVFEHIAYVHVHSAFRSKLDPKAKNVCPWAFPNPERGINIMILYQGK